ncbi:MAG: hypothetical protein OYH77_06945 [Pseudomonadota bacterium]|nr:hypothetical protein [Pseudomonadota bacterium]
MLFSDKDKPKRESSGSIFKKLLILFNLLMIANLWVVKHVDSIKTREPAQAVADLGGDEHDFVNQQERALSAARANGNAVGIIESDLDHALLNYVNQHPHIYRIMSTYWHLLWVGGLLLFFVLYRSFS